MTRRQRWYGMSWLLVAGMATGIGVALVTVGDNRSHASATSSAPTPRPSEDAAHVDPNEADEIDWLAMMPPEELEALRRAPPVDHFGFGMVEQAQSFATVPAMDGRRGKLAGYVVPIKTNEDGMLLEFFLVPYFGACFHVPPPPPNQIVYARLAEPTPVPEIYEPQWAVGTLHVERHDNATAASAYAMNVTQLVPWTE